MAACSLIISFLFMISMGFLCSSHAWIFNVGGDDGWTIKPSENYTHWAERNRIQINDSLVFKYKNGKDCVLVVREDEYYKCNKDNAIHTLNDGKSTFKFDRSGPFFFISGHEQNCEKGQKFMIVVLSEHHHHNGSPALSPPPLQTPLHPLSASPSTSSMSKSPAPTPTTKPLFQSQPFYSPSHAPLVIPTQTSHSPSQAPLVLPTQPSHSKSHAPLVLPTQPSHSPSHSTSPSPYNKLIPTSSPSPTNRPTSSPSPAAKTPSHVPPVKQPSAHSPSPSSPHTNSPTTHDSSSPSPAKAQSSKHNNNIHEHNAPPPRSSPLAFPPHHAPAPAPSAAPEDMAISFVTILGFSLVLSTFTSAGFL